jgi:hypothetical protein
MLLFRATYRRLCFLGDYDSWAASRSATTYGRIASITLDQFRKFQTTRKSLLHREHAQGHAAPLAMECTQWCSRCPQPRSRTENIQRQPAIHPAPPGATHGGESLP